MSTAGMYFPMAVRLGIRSKKMICRIPHVIHEKLMLWQDKRAIFIYKMSHFMLPIVHFITKYIVMS